MEDKVKNTNAIKLMLKHFLFILVPVLNAKYLIPQATDNWIIHSILVILMVFMFSIVYAILEIKNWSIK